MSGRSDTPSPSYDFLWLSLALLPLLLLALLIPLTPYDYWWYLRLGRDILETGAVPRVDTFSFTQAGRPVVYHSWLAGVLLWSVYKAGGLSLTFLLRAAILGLTYVLVYRLNRLAGSGARVAAGLILVAGLAGSNNWSVRPQLLAYPLFVAAVWVLRAWQTRESRGPLWLLPLITVLWANLHGSFPLLFVLGGLALLLGNGDRRRLGLWLGLSLAATLVNPRGPGVWGYVMHMLSAVSNQQFSNEWAVPSNAGWQMNIFFGWLLVFGLLAANATRRLTLQEWGWFLAFGWVALSGVRYVNWFLLLAGPLTAGLLPRLEILDRPPQRVFPAANWLAGGLLLLLALAFLPSVRERWWADAPLPYDEVSTPVAAVDWLAQRPELPGQLWSDFGFSSYLEYALPSRPVWIDTRFEVYPVEHWRRYIAIQNADPGWEAALERDHINLLMLSTRGQARLIDAAARSSEWCEAYRDPHAVILRRAETCP